MKNIADVLPLSGMQQMMLLRALGGQQAGLFVEQLEATLEGRLDVARMRQAWQRTADRHPALRTALVWQGLERPLQVVRQHVELPLSEHDLRGLSPDEQSRRLADWLATVRQEPFDLTQAPLVRLDLFRLTEDCYRFSCRAHHLLFDGWSLAILEGEVLESYASLVAGGRPPDRPPIGFREYVAWLEKQSPTAAEAFWKKQLAGIAAPTPIGFDLEAPSPPAAQAVHAHVSRLPTAEASALRQRLRERQLTLSSLVHAAWAVLLSRHTGRREVVFGTTVSGRPADLPGTETMIGPFMNNVPLRISLAAEQSIPAWLKQVQTDLGELTAFQHTPLAEIERASELKGPARLFESLVVLENYPRVSAELQSAVGLRISDLRATATAIYSLSLVVRPDDFSFDLRCGAARFTAGSAESLLAEFLRILWRLSESAGPCQELLSPPSDVHSLRENAKATAPDFPPTVAVPPWTATSLKSAGQTPVVQAPYIAPRNAVERSLVQVWSELTGREKVGVRDNFFDLGGDSLLAVRLMSEVERQFGRKLPLVWLFQDPTIERLADVLGSGDQPGACLVPIRPRRAGSRPPLFCAHPAGGTVFCYRELAERLSLDQPLYGLQARGIDGREPPRARLEEMAADYVAEMRQEQPAGPYWLLGWSLGGLIVFEMARQLEAQGRPAELVAVIDAGMIAPGESFSEDDFVPMLLQLFPDDLRPTEDELKNLSADEQLAFFRSRAERARLVAVNDSPIQDQHVFQVFQANMTALLEYRPRPFAGKITLFRARQDATPMHGERFMGWGPWALGGVEEHRIAGEHVNLFRDPYISELANEIEKVLSATLKR